MPNGPDGQWKPEAIDRFVKTVDDDGECLMMVNNDKANEGAPEYPLKVDLLCRFEEYSSDRCKFQHARFCDKIRTDYLLVPSKNLVSTYILDISNLIKVIEHDSSLNFNQFIPFQHR